MSFVQEFEREPSEEELADLLNISPKEVSNAMRNRSKYVSFDAPVGGDESDATMLDLVTSEGDDSPDIKLMEESLKSEVEYGLSILAPREVEVIAAYYGLHGEKALTLDEIGDRFGLTRERVRQIKERAIRRMRKSVMRNALKSYLG